MRDTAQIEEAVDRVVGGAVQRELAEGASGEVTVELRRGARRVEVREAGGGWLVTWHGCTPEPSAADGKLVSGLDEALRLAARLLDPEREPEEGRKREKPTPGQEHTAAHGVCLRTAALSSSAAARPDPSSAKRSAAPPPRRHSPPGPEHGLGGRSL
ncbi:hypothetical protein ABZS71_07615 [Streptomyces sp. NPDC005393]|uniref:hypothetical protein n=1 Tax=Streptomyces sp. NPDC005393 TaxID=3157041 RepID=UPI00339DAFF6